MVFPKFNIRIFLLTAFIVSFLQTPQKTFSQQKYDFDFETEWSWLDLINKAVLIEPQLLKTVDDLKNKISIYDARIILKQLSRLKTLSELKQLSEVSKIDQDKNGVIKWDTLLRSAFDNYSVTEDLSGLIKSSLKLSGMRIEYISKDIFEFENRSYLLQPIRDLEKEFKINFDYDGAEKVLNYFDGSGSLDEILGTKAYIEIVTNRGLSDINKDRLTHNLTRASVDDPLQSIYKWINPQCLWDFGGVSVYKNEFRHVIETIKENENNIRFDVEKNISKYLPEGVILEAGLLFLFGQNGPGRVYGKSKLAIDLEYFGDDYSYLVRYIIHQLFVIAQKEIHLAVEEYVVEGKDVELIRLLSNILEHGTANYVGPIGTETRPWCLLEKDFHLFNRTFLHIYKKDSKDLVDTLIKTGYSGNAPFYTMATQMAYIIETTLGRSALTEAITMGPVSFFSQYIKAYKEYPDRIRQVFTFPDVFEKKISALKLLFSENLLKNALELKKLKDQPSNMEEQITRFVDTYGEVAANNVLMNFLAGQLFLESDMFDKSKEYFMKGMNAKKEKGQVAGMIGKSFMEQDAMDQALEFLDLFVESSQADHRAYELRGEYFFERGELSRAKIDFEKALSIYPGSEISENFLRIINSENQ